MRHLHPIATSETRHLFIDPIISAPYSICSELYTKDEETSFIKPGVVPNLMELCRPKGTRFSITEEPDMDKMYIEEVIFGAFDYKGHWTLYHVDELEIGFSRNGPVGSEIKGSVQLDVNAIREYITGDTATLMQEEILVLELDLLYERGTRRLTFKPTGSYDSGKPEIHGIILNLEHKDSKLV